MNFVKKPATKEQAEKYNLIYKDIISSEDGSSWIAKIGGSHRSTKFIMIHLANVLEISISESIELNDKSDLSVYNLSYKLENISVKKGEYRQKEITALFKHALMTYKSDMQDGSVNKIVFENM